MLPAAAAPILHQKRAARFAHDAGLGSAVSPLNCGRRFNLREGSMAHTMQPSAKHDFDELAYLLWSGHKPLSPWRIVLALASQSEHRMECAFKVVYV